MAGPLSDQDVLRLLCAGGVVPVIVAEDVDHVRPLASALKRGGLPVAEVTFRTEASIRALRALAADGDLLVGAGTVIRRGAGRHRARRRRSLRRQSGVQPARRRALP